MNEDVPFEVITPLRWSSDPDDKPPHSDYTIKIILGEISGNAEAEGGEDSTALVGTGDGSSSSSSSTLKRKKEDPPYVEYQVHKVKLFERCHYFNRDELGNECTIVLPQKASDVFSMVLDAIYSSDDSQLALKPKTVAAVAFLAGYFGIPTISAQVTRYFEENRLELGDCEMHYRDAKTFRNQKLEKLIVYKCAENIEAIMETKSPLLGIFDFDFWAEVIDDQVSDSSFERVGSLILTLCSMHKESLDGHSLSKLTDPYGDYLVDYLSVGKIVKLLNLADEVARIDGAPVRLYRDCLRIIELKYYLLHEMLPDLQGDLRDLVIERVTQRSRAVKAATEYAKEMNNNLPLRVRVCGAGIAAVNGLYSRADDFSFIAPDYIMEGMWEGKPKVYHLKYSFEEKFTTWRIFRELEEDVPLYGTYAFMEAYSYPKNVHKFPPTHSWWPGDSIDPRLALTLEYDFVARAHNGDN